MNNWYGLRLTVTFKSDNVLCSDFAKFLDQHGIEMSDIDPTIVNQHVQKLKNYYFWACQVSLNTPRLA